MNLNGPVTLDDLRADPRPLVPVRVAADVLAIPASTIYDCIKRDGAFPIEPVRVGRRVFLRKRDVLRLIDGDGAGHVQEEGATPPAAGGS